MVWDFRSADTAGSPYTVYSDSVSPDRRLVFEHLTHYSFDSSLVHCENALTDIIWHDSTSARILYGIQDKLSWNESTVKDAEGVLRLPQLTTRAWRQHRTVTATLARHPEQKITMNAYVWYHPDYRWPLMSSLRAATSQGQTAFQISLIHQLPDSVAGQIAIEWQEDEPQPSGQGELANSISVFPNPTPDWLYMQIQSTTADQAGIMVFNTSGRIVHTKTAPLATGNNQPKLDLQNLAPGYYILFVQAENLTYQCLFVKI